MERGGRCGFVAHRHNRLDWVERLDKRHRWWQGFMGAEEGRVTGAEGSDNLSIKDHCKEWIADDNPSSQTR